MVGSATPSTSPSAVYVQGRYAYVVHSSNGQFSILDISTPSSPVLISTATVGVGALNAVFVQGRYAYVTDTSLNRLMMVDVSNPSAAVTIGSVPIGTTVPNGASNGLFVQGRYVYAVSGNSKSLQIFDTGGAYIQQLEAGSVEAGTVAVRNNMSIYGDMDVRGGMTVGKGFNTNGQSGITTTGTGGSS